MCGGEEGANNFLDHFTVEVEILTPAETVINLLNQLYLAIGCEVQELIGKSTDQVYNQNSRYATMVRYHTSFDTNAGIISSKFYLTEK